MSKEEILEGNKLIAQFYKDCELKLQGSGFYKCEGNKWNFPQTPEISNLYNNYPIANTFIKALVDINKLHFHSSWDWIMPVVEKMFFTKKINSLSYVKSKIKESLLLVEIESVFKWVVVFINDYNSLTTKTTNNER